MGMQTRTALGLVSPRSAGVRISVARKDLRHRHRETFYDDICVKGLQDVLGHERVVDSGVLILVQFGQIALPDVDHGGCISPRIVYDG
jgi:hypothetical protein